MSIIQGPGSGEVSTGFYPLSISKSLRFNDDDNTYLNKTLTTPTDNKKFTISFWVKRANLSTHQYIISADDGSNAARIQFENDNTLRIKAAHTASGTPVLNYITTRVFRDVGSWYHILFAYDSANSTDTSRARLYVNGTEITDFSTYTKASLNDSILLNSANNHHIGNYALNQNNDLDGYLAQFYLVDGEALTPSTFGETKNDIWVAKNAKTAITALSNGFGNNGFYLTFSDSSDIGADSSGEGHDFTSNNFATSDVVSDSPTNNHATLGAQPIVTHTLSDGNLKSTNSSGTHGGTTATFNYPTSGKWYHEVTINAETNDKGQGVGIGTQIVRTTTNWGNYLNIIAYLSDGTKLVDTGYASYGTAHDADDVIGVAYNADDQELEFYLNGTGQGTIATSEMDGLVDFNNLCPLVFGRNMGQTFNFGQSSFAHTPPSGYKALNTSNLSDPVIDPSDDETPDQYFDVATYTANDGTLTITGLEFQPDFVWIKARSLDISHAWFDVLRGTATAGSTNTAIASNRVDSQGNGNGVLSAFTSDGFTVAGGSSGSNPRNLVNKGTNTYVAWTWKAGGSGSSNGNGSITSTVTASDESGFSIVQYTGTGSNATIGHGLTSAPDVIWIKETTSTSGWICYYSAIGEGKFLSLHSTAAESSSTSTFNNTPPTTSVFSVGTSSATNQSGQTYIAYCFYNVDGYQKIGLYEGNNSTDNAFVFTGFRPRFLMIKNIDATGNWGMWDTEREPSNLMNSIQRADSTTVENSTSPNNDVDILSNGFKIRGNTGVSGDAVTYVYMAIAEQPFKYSNAR